MKNLLLLLILFMLVPFNIAFSQTLSDYILEVKGDTIVIKDYHDMDGEPNSLSQVLALDISSPEGRIYELKKNGYYPLTNIQATLRSTVIVGENKTTLVNNDDAGSTLPLICGVELDGSYRGSIYPVHNLTVKNCNIVPASENGILGWTFFLLNTDGIKLTLENCLFEHTRWTFTAATDAAHCSWHIKDCYFVNMSGQPCRRNGGVFDVLYESQDTLLVENSTHVMGQGMMYKLRANPFNRVIFNHNTFINVSNRVIMDLGWQSAMSVTNNIFVNCNTQPYSPVNGDYDEQDIDKLPIGIINVYPENTITDDRKIFVDKNVVYWDPQLADIASIANTNLVNGSDEWVSQMITMNSRTQAMFDDNVTYPYLFEGDWYQELPNFTDTKNLLTDQVDLLKIFSYTTIDTTSAVVLPDWRLTYNGSENYLYSDWPIPIDLSYDNASLVNGALGGFPVGDINWFPSEKKSWLSQRTVEYDQIADFLNGNSEVKSNFSVDISKGSIPLTVEFTDSSSGVVTSWQWDFENDGIIDSYERNPTWTYFDTDTYSVKLIISNSTFSDTLTKENYIIAWQDTLAKIWTIKDIPEDQGGWVKVQFARSAYDTDSLVFPKAAAAELYTVEINDGSGWTEAASTAAYGKSLYSVLVPTTKDSTAESDGLINFRVIAAMNEGNYVSQEMTGYSVDNLAPAVPAGLLAKQSGTTVELSWQENSDNDFKYYTVYRGDNGSQLQTIKTTVQPVFNDQDITAGHNYSYALSATDHAGNESALSETVNLTVTALDGLSAIPDKYYLGQNFPNPFNPTTTITFGLKESTKVRLMVYDILGNQVAELVNTIYPAGRYQIEWDGTNSFGTMAGTGIYYYKLETEKYNAVRKMIFIK